ncbi:AAA family ATPase [Parabacteroides sp. PF5-6]|uniref:ATP-binding protein n=1 Tax=Parabacteroides sp. PF5-6 TaxID=1742403 RepID=UPI00240554F1|nr:AAA family ATPase [Parabacteroides sp. PF5-6]MDF9830498.1 putative AAA+ superfamily ATPase [Parabacteroides sp. PF5-6]
MYIKRRFIEKLIQWKVNPRRKPLVLQGARQVGKTWLLKHFGETSFEEVAYFNFERQSELKQLFIKTKEPVRIIEFLSVIHGRAINPDTTLIIFDEIQECNEALNALKYFCEEAPEYCIACAGSLLGVALRRGNNSFPVGKVHFLHVHPVTFLEFLETVDKSLSDYLEGINKFEAIPDILFSRIVDIYKKYYLSGGMPEAIVSLLEQGIEGVQETLEDILLTYSLDFSKHIETKEIPKINYIWNSLPSQLARENKKFLYQTVKSGARAREYEDALQWLVNAGLVYRIHRCSKPSLPLSAYDDLSAFKIYVVDVGLLRKLSNLLPTALTEGNRLFTEFKGALTENYILESLSVQFGDLRYWTSERSAEVDFLIPFENEIIPVEVKSDIHTISRSLTLYRQRYSPPISIRFSLKNLKRDADLINIPLFMADLTHKLISF